MSERDLIAEIFAEWDEMESRSSDSLISAPKSLHDIALDQIISSTEAQPLEPDEYSSWCAPALFSENSAINENIKKLCTENYELKKSIQELKASKKELALKIQRSKAEVEHLKLRSETLDKIINSYKIKKDK